MKFFKTITLFFCSLFFLTSQAQATSGALDSTFGTSGLFFDYYDGGMQNFTTTAIAEDSSGKIISVYDITISDVDGNNVRKTWIARHNTNGSLDTNFGTSGYVVFEGDYYYTIPYDVLVDSSDNIYVIGANELDATGNIRNGYVIKLDSSGDLVSDFGEEGWVDIDLGNVSSEFILDTRAGVLFTADEKIALAGGTDAGDFEVIVLDKDTGDLDTSFSTDGYATFDIGSSSDIAYSIATDSNDNLIVAGSTGLSSNADFAVIRVASAGILDPTFNSSMGIITIDFSSDFDVAKSVVVDSSDNVFVAGYSDNGTDFDIAIAALTSAGALDTNFDTDGKNTYDYSSDDDVGIAVALDSSEDIFVIGRASNGSDNDILILKYDPATGNLDSTYSTDGVQEFDVDDESVSDLFLDASDKLVLGGSVYDTTNDVTSGLLARFNTDASLDTTFDTDGYTTFDLGDLATEPKAIAIDENGKLIIAGIAREDQNNSNFNFYISRLDTDGTLDTTFGTNGFVSIDILGIDGIDAAYDVDLDSEGRIVVAGYATTAGAESKDFAVVRLDSDGSLDTTFHSDGIRTFNFGLSDDEEVYDLVIASNDDIFLIGYANNSNDEVFAIAKISGVNGNLRSSFSSDGKLTFSFPGTSADTVGSFGRVGVIVDGSLFVGGYTSTSADDELALAKISSDGSLDTSFSSDGKINFDISADGDELINDIKVDSDGNLLLIVEYDSQGSTGYDYAVMKVDTDGDLVTAYGDSGIQTVDFDSDDDIVIKAALDSSDNLYLIGYRTSDSITKTGIVVLDSSGNLVTEFDAHDDEDGIATYDFGYNDEQGRAILLDEASNDKTLYFASSAYLGMGVGKITINDCGNSTVEFDEECDDGNSLNTDECLNTCVSAACGDGFTQADEEECDDGDDNSDTVVDACRSTCVAASCGDGVTDTGEECDDGNSVDDDDCSNVCEENTTGGDDEPTSSGGCFLMTKTKAPTSPWVWMTFFMAFGLLLRKRHKMK